MTHQNRIKRNAYSLLQYERLIEIERKSEKTYAMQNNKIEMYEKDERNITTQF